MGAIRISLPDPTERGTALAALLDHILELDRPTVVSRVLRQFETGELDPAGLLVARTQTGQILGAIFSQRLAGATAAVWPPGFAPGIEAAHSRDAVADALAHAVVQRLRGVAKVAHSFAREPDRHRLEPLLRAGFQRVTELRFLTRPIPGPGNPIAAESSPSRLDFEQVSNPGSEFVAALTATYEGTLDCPELNGTRTGDEILSGYLAAVPRDGPFPDWFRVLDAKEPVGVLMFGPHSRMGTAELSYLGLVPNHRGRGLGQEVLRFALAHAARIGAEWMTLSVDTRNEPALRLYDRHDFRPFDSQGVYLWKPEVVEEKV